MADPQGFAAQMRERAAAAQQAAMAQVAAPAEGLVDALTKLADLRDRGALTDQEFQAQKKRLLGE